MSAVAAPRRTCCRWLNCCIRSRVRLHYATASCFQATNPIIFLLSCNWIQLLESRIPSSTLRPKSCSNDRSDYQTIIYYPAEDICQHCPWHKCGQDPSYWSISNSTRLWWSCGEDLAAVLNAYMVGIKDVFAFSMAGVAFTVFLALVIPLKKVPSHGWSYGALCRREALDLLFPSLSATLLLVLYE